MPNPNLIKPKQLDSSLYDLIRQIESGDIGQALFAYGNTGYHGPNVLYITGGGQTILGQKTFNLSPNIPYSGGDNQAISKAYVSDEVNVLQSGINAINSSVLHTTGNESALGIKTFVSAIVNQGITGNSINFVSGRFTTAALVPSPSNPQSAINLSYFYNQGIVFNTGDQNIAGNKTFTNSPILSNQAINQNQAARFDQLVNSGTRLQTQINALAKASGSKISGFGGVISFNGESGNIIAIGRGNVTVQQQGDITFISGAMPVLSGSGVYLIQGEQGLLGPYFHPRGTWQGGLTYSYLDVVSLSGNAWVSTTGHLSSASNMPGTGGSLLVAPWQFFVSSGKQGATGITGAWQYRGAFGSGVQYFYNNAVSYVGSTYGLGITGSFGLLAPTGAGWYTIAQSGSIGPIGVSGYSGRSGYSGYSGSGKSGYSGYSGSGKSGYSGYSGTGKSGYSGYSGRSGYSSHSGFSGYSGIAGNAYYGEVYVAGGTATSSVTSTFGIIDQFTTSGPAFGTTVFPLVAEIDIAHDGFYEIHLTVSIAFDTADHYILGVFLNGVLLSSMQCEMIGTADITRPQTMVISGIRHLVPGDQVSVLIKNVSGSGNYTIFQGNFSVVPLGAQGLRGISGYSGYSSKSGYSGYSGKSGFSGLSGYSGYSGSGVSGYSGYSGAGLSGFSGYSGYSGFSGRSGFSGYSSAVVGPEGPPGLAFAWKSNWLSTGNYASGNAVYYQGSSYGILQSTSGTIPSTGVPWFLIAQSGQPTIWRDGNGVPDNASGIDGDFWLNDVVGDIYRRAGGAYTVITNISAGLAQRITVSGTTNSIPYLQTTGMFLSMAKTSAIISVNTTYPAWVRMYGSIAERSGDAGRPIDADPVPGSGVMFDGITTSGSPTLWTSPVATFTSHENPPSTGVPIAITNTIAGTGQIITLTVQYLQLEK